MITPTRGTESVTRLLYNVCAKEKSIFSSKRGWRRPVEVRKTVTRDEGE